ncbi:MAG: cell wall-binding repeat-containing protein [Coriobacteriia bacterium]
MRASRGIRSLLVLTTAAALLMGVVPAQAFGAVTLTWERNWGTLGTFPNPANGTFSNPANVAVDKWGNVYVTGGIGDARVQMFDEDGTFIKKYDNPGVSPTQLSTPWGIGTDRWGNIYVGQYANDRIEVFNPTLYSHLRTIDSSLPAQVTGIDVALNGTIYNARYGLDVQRRDWLGETIGPPLLPPFPVGVGVSQDGELYVATLNDMIGVYREDGSLKYAWGGAGTDPGEYSTPYDVGVDGAGNVFVVEFSGDRGQVLSSNSSPLTMFGSSGSGDQQFRGPSGIAVGYDRTVYVTDYAHHRISKWNVSVPTSVTAVAGASRYATAVEASKKAYPDGADIVVLATGSNWPDALGGAALAGAVHGPLLLTMKDTLPAEVAAELDRIEPKRVYVLGGTGVVSNAVMDAARSHTTMDIATRLDGDDRYKTAVEVAAEVKAMRGSDYDGTAFVCTGANFPDALAAAPIAAANGWPIYLTPPDAIPEYIQTALLATYGGNPSNHGYIIGGESAVSNDVHTVLNAPPFMGYGRYAGDNRYETAADVARIGYEGMGLLYSRPAIATGEDFPDALAGGVLQGSDYTVLLLTPKNSLHPATAAALAGHKDMIYEIRFMGGTGVVSTPVRNAARALLW